MRQRFAIPLLAAFIAIGLGFASSARDRDRDDDAWLSAGNGPSDNHYARGEDFLSSKTVHELHELWSFKTSGDVPNIPTVSGDAVYTTDNGGSVWRINRRTGKAVWQVSLPALTGDKMEFARTSPAIGRRVVVIGDQARGTVYALDKEDGHVVWKTRLSTAPRALITSSPLIHDGRVYVGVSSLQEELAADQKGFKPNFRGSAASLDLEDGHVLWQTYTVPEGFTGGAVWGSNLAADLERGVLYVTTGDNYSVPDSVSDCQLGAASPAAFASCLPWDDHIDSVMALDIHSGKLKWARRLTKGDTWTVSCLPSTTPPANPCPRPAGPDYDFGSAANLFSITVDGERRDLVGAGQKSGNYWAFDRDTGHTVWVTRANPGGTRGGIEWGTATDGKRIYVAASNSRFIETELLSGEKTNGGWWSALDPVTGQILWETPSIGKQPPLPMAVRGSPPPPGARARTEGALTTANGVVYGGDTAGYFVALDAATGHVLWKLDSGGSVIGAPAVVNGKLYWGSGYTDVGKANTTLFALGLEEPDRD